jgi:hypothetical protein
MSGDLRQEPERPSFNPALMVITGQREGALGDSGRPRRISSDPFVGRALAKRSDGA